MKKYRVEIYYAKEIIAKNEDEALETFGLILDQNINKLVTVKDLGKAPKCDTDKCRLWKHFKPSCPFEDSGYCLFENL